MVCILLITSSSLSRLTLPQGQLGHCLRSPSGRGAQNFEKEEIVKIKIESFEFLLGMTIWYNILFAVNPISKSLQLIKRSHFLF